MPHWILSIALIPGLLLAHFASLARCHAYTEHSERVESRPHFHLSNDSHDHAGHSHNHRHSPEPEEPALDIIGDSPDHDADAIYTGDFDSVGGERAGWVEFVSGLQHFDFEGVRFEVPSLLAVRRSVHCTPSLVSLHHCALYVEHLALLI